MIILVEDDRDQRLSLKLALNLAGYTLRDAANGREALALQRERPSQILITDIFMPEADGFELIAAFRREFSETKIIVISGGRLRMRGGDYLQSARLIGAHATLQKPFEIKALLDVLRTLKH
jgi:DNA-binding NtrC family response regulator